MSQRVTYVGPFDSIELAVGDGRYELVRSANPSFDGYEYPEHLAHVAEAPTTITVSDEFAAHLLGPEGVESDWIKAGGKAQGPTVDDPSLPALRWTEPTEGARIEPATGFVSPAELAELEEARLDEDPQGDAIRAEREAAAAAQIAAGQRAAISHAEHAGEELGEFVDQAVTATVAVPAPETSSSSESASPDNDAQEG